MQLTVMRHSLVLLSLVAAAGARPFLRNHPKAVHATALAPTPTGLAGANLTAMIVEPRCHPALALVLANMHARLPHVPVQLFYSHSNEDFVNGLKASLAKTFATEGKADPVANWLSLSPLPGRFFWGLSYNDYSVLLEDPSFWDNVRGDKVLLFQVDSWICRNAAKKLQAFLRYDYVGAPWKNINAGCRVGNGGLSLRTKRVMQEAGALSVERGPGAPPEDIFFCHWLQGAGHGQMPTVDEANEFSTENWFTPRRDPFGVHQPWASDLRVEWPMLKPNCEGLDLMMGTQQVSKNCAVANLLADSHLYSYSGMARKQLQEALREEAETAPQAAGVS